MIKNIHGQDVDINVREEIRKALEKGETMSQFGVRMAKKHEIYVNQSTWYSVKNAPQRQSLKKENEELKARIAALEKTSKKSA